MVTATSVQLVRLRHLKSFEREPLWRDNDLVTEVCEQVSLEEQKHKYMSKITEVLGNVATHASDRLNNLAYVFRGVDMVVASPWLKDCSPQEKEWLYIIEATEQAKFDSQERQDTKDLSLTSLTMFHKSPAT